MDKNSIKSSLTNNAKRISNTTKSIVGKTKNAVVKTIDQNADNKLSKEDLNLIKEKITSKTKETSANIKATIDKKKQDNELKRLKPIFREDLEKVDFITQKLICISEPDKNFFESDVCKNAIGRYTDYKNSNPKDYREKMTHRLGVRNSIYSALSKSYNNNNKIVSHFYSKDKHIPIWGIFEIITLGTFADLIKSLKPKTRIRIDKEMRINISYDTNAKFPERIMYLIKALRNSVAHNDVVFDVRFKDSNINSSLCKYIEDEINCTNVNFKTITDYILIIAILLKKYEISKTELNHFVNEYENIIEEFRNNIPFNIYSQVIHTDTKIKLTQLRKYIKK